MHSRADKVNPWSPSYESEFQFFRENAAPPNLDEYCRAVSAFVQQQCARNRRLVFVTSGGTIVPLEGQIVRFVDNFSTGTRGAASAEYFLDAGYAVVFLHRKDSPTPWSQRFGRSADALFESLSLNSNDECILGASTQDVARAMLKKRERARQNQLLLILSFTTITEYLWYLRTISTCLQPCGSRALIYLAAAVSDFYIPHHELPKHKLQAGRARKASPEMFPHLDQQASQGLSGDSITINFRPVPKMIRVIVEMWAPEAMTISFKLETDTNLLLAKAQKALRNAPHSLVIGNLLHSRYSEVVFVTPSSAHWLRIPDKVLTEHPSDMEPKSSSPESPVEIESMIIDQVSSMHQQFINRSEEEHEADEQHAFANAMAWADSPAE